METPSEKVKRIVGDEDVANIAKRLYESNLVPESSIPDDNPLDPTIDIRRKMYEEDDLCVDCDCYLNDDSTCPNCGYDYKHQPIEIPGVECTLEKIWCAECNDKDKVIQALWEALVLSKDYWGENGYFPRESKLGWILKMADNPNKTLDEFKRKLQEETK